VLETVEAARRRQAPAFARLVAVALEQEPAGWSPTRPFAAALFELRALAQAKGYYLEARKLVTEDAPVEAHEPHVAVVLGQAAVLALQEAQEDRVVLGVEADEAPGFIISHLPHTVALVAGS
jgi:hypothetical protein